MAVDPMTPRLTALALAVLLVPLLIAGCGDDEEKGAAGSADAPASTTLPDGGDATVPDLPRNEDPSGVQCTAPPKGVFDATEIVGESLQGAERAAQAEGCSVREVERDGESLAVTEDFRPDRVNVATENGEVTRIVSLG
jgi:hypothetical protein